MSVFTKIKLNMNNRVIIGQALTAAGYTHRTAAPGTKITAESNYTTAEVDIQLTGYTNGATNAFITNVGVAETSEGWVTCGDFWRVNDNNGKDLTAEKLSNTLLAHYQIIQAAQLLPQQGFMQANMVETEEEIEVLYQQMV